MSRQERCSPRPSHSTDQASCRLMSTIPLPELICACSIETGFVVVDGAVPCVGVGYPPWPGDMGPVAVRNLVKSSRARVLGRRVVPLAAPAACSAAWLGLKTATTPRDAIGTVPVSQSWESV